MNSRDLEGLSREFGIRDLEEIREPERYDYTYVSFSSMNSSRKYTTVNTSYRITVEKEFMYALLNSISHNDRNPNNTRIDGPKLDILYNYLYDTVNKEKREKKLQEQHPELAEIMKEYEVMKALLLQK